MMCKRQPSIVKSVVAKFGGPTKTARALGLPHPSTVGNWIKRGLIPAHQQAALLDAAIKLGIDLSPSDFFDPAKIEASIKARRRREREASRAR